MKKSLFLFISLLLCMALLLCLVLQIGLAQFSGAILRRPNVSVYLALVLAVIHYQTVWAPTLPEKE